MNVNSHCKQLYGWICQKSFRSSSTIVEIEATFYGQMNNTIELNNLQLN